MAGKWDKLTFMYGDHNNVYHAADESPWNSCLSPTSTRRYAKGSDRGCLPAGGPDRGQVSHCTAASPLATDAPSFVGTMAARSRSCWLSLRPHAITILLATSRPAPMATCVHQIFWAVRCLRPDRVMDQSHQINGEVLKLYYRYVSLKD